MKVRYYGQPFLHVIDYKRPCKEVFCFPESGVYETEDEKLIAWMKKNKPHIQCEECVEETEAPEKTPDPVRVENHQEESDDELSRLREKAKQSGIQRAHLMKKETLLKKIAEIENC